MTSRRDVAVLLGFILLAGCPQLLNDDFQQGGLDAGLILDDNGSGGTADTSASGAGGTDVGSRGAAGADAGTSDAGGAEQNHPDASAPGPAVVSAVPADGARGVLADAELVFTFSAPMDTSSVHDAYVSSELPVAQVSFTWSAGDTVLGIRPNSPFNVATGSDPATVVPASYAVDFTSQAKDKAGHALVPEHVGFSVVRSITQQLNAVEDRNLTGNWRGDNMYGSLYCESTDTTICMGDGTATYKAFITFNLADVPVDLISFSAAELSSTVQYVFGAPFTALGALDIEHVEFSAIGTDAYAAAPLAAARTMSTAAAANDTLSADVLADVRTDWGTRARSQFRLSFVTATNSDSVADQVVCDWSTVHLALSYLTP
jgi:hypothetical protein